MGFFKRLIDLITLRTERPVRRLLAYYLLLAAVLVATTACQPAAPPAPTPTVSAPAPTAVPATPTAPPAQPTATPQLVRVPTPTYSFKELSKCRP